MIRVEETSEGEMICLYLDIRYPVTFDGLQIADAVAERMNRSALRRI